MVDMASNLPNHFRISRVHGPIAAVVNDAKLSSQTYELILFRAKLPLCFPYPPHIAFHHGPAGGILARYLPSP
jgi:hypothetical protein